MPLEVNEEAIPFSLYERIHTCLPRLSQNHVTGGTQGVFADLVPTGMGKMDPVARVVGDQVISHLIESEDPKPLILEPVTRDAITVKYAGMRGQAGENGGAGIALGPVQEVGENAPVRFVAQVRAARLCAGHDDGIEITGP